MRGPGAAGKSQDSAGLDVGLSFTEKKPNVATGFSQEQNALSPGAQSLNPRPQAQEDWPGFHSSAVPILKFSLHFKQEASFSFRLQPPT